ncbi:MAG: hypothetical protein KDA58_02805 [Planctomycetaceae bacterium]|nr:hypothetical protein [Planctomycetaceae bacterium]
MPRRLVAKAGQKPAAGLFGALLIAAVGVFMLALVVQSVLVLTQGTAQPGRVLRIGRRVDIAGTVRVQYAFPTKTGPAKQSVQLDRKLAAKLDAGQAIEVRTHPWVFDWLAQPQWPGMLTARIAGLGAMLVGSLLFFWPMWSFVRNMIRTRVLLTEGVATLGTITVRNPPHNKTVTLTYVYQTPNAETDRLAHHTGAVQVPVGNAELVTDAVTVLYDTEHPDRSVIYETAAWAVDDAQPVANFHAAPVPPQFSDEPVSLVDSTTRNDLVLDLDFQTTQQEINDYTAKYSAASRLRSWAIRLAWLLAIAGPATLLLLRLTPRAAMLFGVVATILGLLFRRINVRQFLVMRLAIRATPTYLELRFPEGCSRRLWPHLHRLNVHDEFLEVQLAPHGHPLLLTQRMFESPAQFQHWKNELQRRTQEPSTIRDLTDWPLPHVLDRVTSHITRGQMRRWILLHGDFRGLSRGTWAMLLALLLAPWIAVLGLWTAGGWGFLTAAMMTIVSQLILVYLALAMWPWWTGRAFPKEYTQDVLLTKEGVYLLTSEGQSIYPWSRVHKLDEVGECVAIYLGTPPTQVVLIPVESWTSSDQCTRFRRTAQELWRS